MQQNLNCVIVLFNEANNSLTRGCDTGMWCRLNVFPHVVIPHNLEVRKAS